MHVAALVGVGIALALGGCVTASSPFLVLDKYEVEALLIGRTERGRVLNPVLDGVGPAGTPYAIRYFEGDRLTYQTPFRAGAGIYGFHGDALCRRFDGGVARCHRIVRTSQGYMAIGRGDADGRVTVFAVE